MAKKKHFLCRIDGRNYYTTNTKLVETKELHDKWEARYSIMGMWWFMMIVFITPPAVFIEEGTWNLGTIISLSIGVSYLLFIIIWGIITGKKTDKYASWNDIFTESNEFKKQLAKYKKIEKEKQELVRKEKATRLVESYEILDNYKITKEEKIELIKKYIE